MNKCCKSCRYRTQMAWGFTVCDYACKTGVLRGGKIEECNKWRPKTMRNLLEAQDEKMLSEQ